MHAHKLWAQGLGFMHTHVAGDAGCSRCIIYGNEALPLLDSNRQVGGNAQALLLDLA